MCKEKMKRQQGEWELSHKQIRPSSFPLVRSWMGQEFAQIDAGIVS
jgi:hypothetical protein